MALTRGFYAQLAVACFAVGAGIELFMIKTGFYSIVTQAEAAAWEEGREERAARAAELRERVLEHYATRGQAPPPALLEALGGGKDGGGGSGGGSAAQQPGAGSRAGVTRGLALQSRRRRTGPMQQLSGAPLFPHGREFDTILIDLDDTLYRNDEIPATVRANITAYIVRHLGVPAEAAAALTAELYAAHGTTMAGLAATGHALDWDHWHAEVHGSLDYARLLSPQPATRQVLLDLNLQRHILTNADAAHTAACLERMGLADCFQARPGRQRQGRRRQGRRQGGGDGAAAARLAQRPPRGRAAAQSVWCFESVMELAAAKGALSAEAPVMCKPAKQVYELVLAQLGARASSTIFVDDSPRNVAAAKEVGIFSVLVSPSLAASPGHHPHHHEGADLVIASFTQLPEVLPQIFAPREAPAAEALPAGVPVRVLAS
ncbi:SPAC24B11.05 [Scenedesmus sp. PABB004]|nr:SPAC24B11.05 [Scenedesmus sp. PABB004]